MGCLFRLFHLIFYLILSVVFAILAMLPLVAADAIYTGKWAAFSIQNLLMCDEGAFASALGGVLSDHPLWQMFHGILGGIADRVNVGINLQFFFADAATLNLSLYGLLELIGSAVFMLLWFRVQMDVLAMIFRFVPLSAVDPEKGFIGCILDRFLSSLYFSVALLGAFFSTVLFNAVKMSTYPTVYIIVVLVAEIVLFFGAREISISGSNFEISLSEQIAGSLIKTATMFIGMYISFYYFSGGVPSGDLRIVPLVLSWISVTNGIAGVSIGYQLGGFIATVIFACFIII